jgi:ABC-type polysaccharide/polyol phosphate export permease
MSARVPALELRRWTWLLASFTQREVLERYAGSVSGLLWTLIHPLAQLAIFSFIFSHVFRTAVPREYAGAGYVSFVAVSLWPWIMFSEGLQRAMGAVAGNSGLIRKVAFPHFLLVLAALAATLAIHIVGYVAVLIALRVAGEPIHFRALPVAAALMVPYVLLAAGLGAALAALRTLLKDVEHVVAILLQMAFYAAPILYPPDIVPEPWRHWIMANPPAWFSERMREALLLGRGLEPADAVVALVCVGVFGVGVWIFQRLSPHFEDLL